MIHVHELDGCAPAPLGHYLKALGVLRLVAEQSDEDARGWWVGDRFRLATTLTRDELEGFFLRKYKPTPLVAPWNKGARFFAESDPVLSAIERTRSSRFREFRAGVNASRTILKDLSQADRAVRDIKAEAKARGMSTAERQRIRASADYKERLGQAERLFEKIKADLIPNFRLQWRGKHQEWLDAAMVLSDDLTPRYPALLGTGGNDGRLNFAYNFMRHVGEVFDLASDDGAARRESSAWVTGALWRTPVPGNLVGPPVGQYLPGTAGGANNANGPRSDSLVNPVDFILMLEGAMAFRSHATSRFGLSESTRAASPFAVNAVGAAYVSAASGDESARGEQWMPLWSRPITYAELRRLLAEGRAQVGANPAREPLDVARAVSRLGTARGIKAFQRYGYIERNGQSNLAVPLGRFEAADRQSEHVACIDDLDLWLRRVRREARDQHRLAGVERYLVDALFLVTQRPDEPRYWQRVLLQLAEVEGTMARGSGFTANPVPKLRPDWVAASHDGSAEFRLALSFALQAPIDPVRRHWLPLDSQQPWRFATAGTGVATRLDVKPEVVMLGRRGLDDATSLVQRRLVEASQSGLRHLPLMSPLRSAASIADLTQLLAGGVDLDRTLALARAFMALDRKAWAHQPVPIESPQTSDWPDDAWLAIRLCALPWPIKTRSGFELDIGTDPALVRRLATGDAASAVALALRRLRAAGVSCTVRAGTATPHTARLWAAALAFPVTKTTAQRFLGRLDPNKEAL